MTKTLMFASYWCLIKVKFNVFVICEVFEFLLCSCLNTLALDAIVDLLLGNVTLVAYRRSQIWLSKLVTELTPKVTTQGKYSLLWHICLQLDGLNIYICIYINIFKTSWAFCYLRFHVTTLQANATKHKKRYELLLTEKCIRFLNCRSIMRQRYIHIQNLHTRSYQATYYD